MKNVFKAVIEKGGYDLTTILTKIDTLYIEGKITDKERTELCFLARKSPEPQYDYKVEIEKLWEAVRTLQSNETTEGDINTPKEFKQPTGAHNAYMNGDTIVYNGKIYESIIDNNVWSPDTYPNGWEVIG